MARRAPIAGKRKARPVAAPGTAADLSALMDALGHHFEKPALLTEALTHRSATADSPFRFGYERLEFLGDRVLGLIVADMLVEAFPEDPEGALARRFTGLVRRETLEKVAAVIGLDRHLILGEAEKRAGARAIGAIRADSCEALIGALYLDGGLAAARRFVLAQWGPLLGAHGQSLRDAKTRLQEWSQARGLALPAYSVVEREGPDHEPLFTVSVTVSGLPAAHGTAASKRSAEQAAAQRLLDTIAESMGDGG